MSDEPLISAGTGPFGCAQDPEIVPCAVCGDPVQHLDKFMVEKEIIHKTCFICAYCDARLQVGYCVQELALYNRYGPCWYCTLICAHRPLAEKEAKMKEKGVEVRNPSTRRPKPKGVNSAAAAAAGINVAPAGGIAPAVVETEQKQPEKGQEGGQDEIVPQGDGAAKGKVENVGENREAGAGEGGANNDGPEMEAEEVEMEAEEVPKKVEGEVMPAGANVAEPKVPENAGDDGVEMEAEEVPKQPAPTEQLAQADEPIGANVGIEAAEGGEGAGVEGAAGGNGDSETGGEGAGPTGAAPKESKPVAMDAYENKYRLQMKKKK